MFRHFVLVLFLFVPQALWCQRVEYRQVSKYTTADGLSSYNIRKITKDQNGFLWVATQYGLSRFDGRSFSNYSLTAAAGARLSSVDVRDLSEDTANKLLYVLPGGADKFDVIDLRTYKVIRHYAIPQYNVDEFAMSDLLAGHLFWTGTSTGFVVTDLNTGTASLLNKMPCYDSVHDPHDLEVNNVYKDCYDNVWAFHSGFGLVIFDGKSKKVIKAYPLSLFNDHLHNRKIVFNGCITTGAGKLLAATSQGLREITFDRAYNLNIDITPCKSVPQLNVDEIDAICQTKSGDILIASHNELYRLNATLNNYTVIKEIESSHDGNWLASVQTIYCDGDNNIWLGCEQGLAFIRGRKSPFRPIYFDAQANQFLNHVRSIFVPDSNTILVGLRNGLAKINAASMSFSISDEQHLYHHIFADHLGKLIVSRDDGLFTLAENKLTAINAVYPEFNDFEYDPVNSHIFIGDSLLILGTENDNGILVWNYIRHTVRQVDQLSHPGLASSVVNNLYLDSSGRTWVLSDHTISVFSMGFTQVTHVPVIDSNTGQRINLLFDMCEAGGSYWLVAYGIGLVEIDDNFKVRKIYNTLRGLSDDGVYQVFHSGNNLVVTTDNGLSVLNLQTRRFNNYYQADGLHSNSFEEVAGIMKHNIIYAGGVKGFTIIDPARFFENTKPPAVYISRVFVDRAGDINDVDTTNITMENIVIPNDVLGTTVYFSGINYNNPERTSFAYQIVENNGDWVNTGRQNYINLIGLRPGTYHLQVKAANEDNIWSQPVQLTLVFLPKWYQTIWFIIGLTVIGLAICYLIYRVRLYQILKQQKIRKQIASDLHDDIGSSLNSVKVFAHLAQNTSEPKEYLRGIEENLEETTAGLRDMIWVLDSKFETLDDLCSRLDRLPARTVRAAGIDTIFEIADVVKYMKLTKPQKRNLYLIVKEAMNNSMKYAQCTTIRVVFEQKNRKLIMSIVDNGRGYDTNEAAGKGYGLGNMKIRAEQIYFILTIHSDSFGTKIIVTEK